MNKLTGIIISTALAFTAGQAAAQSIAGAAAQGVMQGAVQAAGLALVSAATAATSANAAPVTAPAPSAAAPVKPLPLVVKDFAAARSLELERTKVHLGAIEKFRKCVEGAKAASDLTSCQGAYRATLTANVASLTKQGKFAAAYQPAAQPITLTSAAPATGK